MMEKMLKKQLERGKTDALALRSAAHTMTDSELIAAINCIPKHSAKKDYSSWPVGAPVKDMVDGEFVIYRLLIPHNAAEHSGIPSELVDLWEACNMVLPASPTTEERIAELEAANAALEDALCDMDSMLEELRNGGETA